MASIGLPQESRHPFHFSNDLCSTPLNLRFVSAQSVSSTKGHRLIVRARRLYGEDDDAPHLLCQGMQECKGASSARKGCLRNEQQNLNYEARWAP